MWKSAVDRIRNVEAALSQNGEYIDKNDAVNLASVDISSPLIQLDESQERRLPTYHGNTDYLKYQQQSSDIEVVYTETNLLGIDDLAPSLINDWNQLPGAEDVDNNDDEIFGSVVYNSPHLRYVDRKRKTDALRNKLGRRMEDLNNTLQIIMDTKVYCYKTIKTIFETYIHLLISEAHNVGVSNALYRANIATKPQLSTVLQHRFFDVTEIVSLQERIENACIELYPDDIKLFSERSLSLKYSFSENLTNDWITNLKIGIGGTLLLWAISECFNNEKLGHHIWNDSTFAIFMCLGNLLLLLWMWGVSIHVWRTHDIDFIRLLQLHGSELDNTNHPERLVYKSASDMTLLFLFVFILFNKIIRGVFDLNGSLILAHSLPIVMIFYFLYRMTFPWHRRKKWYVMLWTVLASPFYPVSFRDGYIGDILTSLVRVLISMCFSSLYLLITIIDILSFDTRFEASTSNIWWEKNNIVKKIIIPFLSLYPLWIRLMQCLRRSIETGHRWPHMANALKYTSAIIVITFGIYHRKLHKSALWITSFIFATIYQFIWDITMDWGFIVWSTSNYRSPNISFLGLSIRENRLFGSLWLYFSVMIGNLFFRFAWILTLLPPTIVGSEGSVSEVLLYHLGPIIAACEVLRRMVWGFYRLEYEQLEVVGVLGTPEYITDKVDILSSVRIDPVLKHSSVDLNFDWITQASNFLSFFPSIKLFGLTSTSTLQQRGRFIESILFVSIIIITILYAALSAK